LIRKELKDEIESIANRLDEKNPAEKAAKSVLLALIGASGVNQEIPLMDHVAVFSRRLMGVVAKTWSSEIKGRN
jgi:hypothetical protein